jgi:amidase
MSKAQGIDTLLVGEKVDAVLFPGSSGAEFASRAGYPGLVVPFGMVTNPGNGPDGKPTGEKDRPFGVSFVGAECSEPKVLAIGYAFEQATKKRVPPPQFP